MKRYLKVVLIVLSIALLAGGLFVASFPLQWWNISVEDLRAKYQRPESQFVTIDGAKIHFQDQGNAEGKAVVLLHGNFANLRAYDEWLPFLGDRYRLIRFDSPLSGLSGADSTGDYSIERRIFLMRQLLEHLDVAEYFLVATSFNAPTAFRVASREPHSVLGLILGNAGGLPRTVANNPNRPEKDRIMRWIQQYYFPRSFFERTLVRLLPDPERRGDEIVEQFHLMVTAKGRPGEGGQILRQFDSQDAQSYLQKIAVPVLLQWTTDGDQPLLVDKDLVRYQAWLNSAPVQTIEYDGVGHMLYQNAPEQTATDAGSFMDAVLTGDFTGDDLH